MLQRVPHVISKGPWYCFNTHAPWFVSLEGVETSNGHSCVSLPGNRPLPHQPVEVHLLHRLLLPRLPAARAAGDTAAAGWVSCRICHPLRMLLHSVCQDAEEGRHADPGADQQHDREAAVGDRRRAEGPVDQQLQLRKGLRLLSIRTDGKLQRGDQPPLKPVQEILLCEADCMQHDGISFAPAPPGTWSPRAAGTAPAGVPAPAAAARATPAPPTSRLARLLPAAAAALRAAPLPNYLPDGIARESIWMSPAATEQPGSIPSSINNTAHRCFKVPKVTVTVRSATACAIRCHGAGSPLLRTRMARLSADGALARLMGCHCSLAIAGMHRYMYMPGLRAALQQSEHQ